MKNIINKDKIITIGILPIMWLIYFLFEVFSGRVNDLYTLILNLSLIFLFAFVGWIIYMYSIKKKKKKLKKKLFQRRMVTLILLTV